jgi:ribosomal protein S1
MAPTPEEIEDVALIENPQFEEAVEAYQEFKAKIMEVNNENRKI